MRGKAAVFMALVMLAMSGVSWSAMGDRSWDWSSPTGSDYYYIPKVAIDSQGNRIVAYAVLDSSFSKSYGHIVCFDSSGHVKWDADISKLSKNFFLSALVVDKDDNVIVGGQENNGSDDDWKVVKFSPSGTKLREFSYSYGDDELYDLAVDSHGNIIGVGKTKGSTSSFYYGLVYFFSSSKVVLWSRLTESTVGRVVVDSNDNVIVLGEQKNSGQMDWKVVSYSSSGTTLWSQTFDSGNGDDYPEALAVDDSGNVAVVGKAKRAAGDYDWKVLFYQVSGSSATLKWSDQINGDGHNDAATAVAIDGSGNVVVGGYQSKGGDDQWLLVSYSSSTGVKRWSATYDSTMGDDAILGVAAGNGIVVAVGYSGNGSDNDWRVRAYSAVNGAVKWDDVCASGGGGNDYALDVAMDSNGGAFVAGECDSMLGICTSVKVVDYEGVSSPSGGDTGGDTGGDNGTDTGGDNGTGGGGTTPLKGHILRPAEVRTINTPPATPAPLKDTYLGFGSAATGGTNFKLQASFPQYINTQKTSAYEVKIFIAAQLPDDYSRLLYITSSNAIEYQPPDKLSSWKSKVKGIVPNTVILNTSTSSMPSGVHYWYTLVVPSSVPDDFSGVDWSTIPWEVTVNVLNLQ